MKRCREKTMSFLYLKSWTTGLDHGSQVYPEVHSGPGALHSQRNHWIHRWVSWCRVLCFRRVVHIHKYRIYKRKVIWNWNWVVHYHLSLPHIKQECGFILLDAQLPLIFQITLCARERLLLPHYLWLSIIICPNRPQSIWTVIPRLRFCFHIRMQMWNRSTDSQPSSRPVGMLLFFLLCVRDAKAGAKTRCLFWTVMADCLNRHCHIFWHSEVGMIKVER